MSNVRLFVSLLLFATVTVAPLAVPITAHATDLQLTTRRAGASVYVHAPAQPSDGTPARVIVILHGMGGNGPDLAQPWLSVAEDRGWIIVAPTFNYGDWHDPQVIRAEDQRLSQDLTDLLDQLPYTVDRPVSPKALVFGFSRGAQLAHRFALLNPEHVQAVAALSAGSYTLPDTEMWISNKLQKLNFPFGVADLDRLVGHTCSARALARVHFWIGVGLNDVRPDDVPRDWDPYLGKNRVVRARSFTRALERHHVPVALNEFPGADHEFNPTIRASALSFFDAETALSANANFALAPAGGDAFLQALSGS